MWKGSRLNERCTRLDKKVVQNNGVRCHEIVTFLVLLPEYTALVA